MKKIKALIVMLIFAGAGLSLTFSKEVSAATLGNIYFYINLPGGSFDRNSLLTPSDNPDLARADSIGYENGQEYVWRQVKDTQRSKIGRVPKMIGKPGYTLYNQQWNTNPEMGGTLWQGFEARTFSYLFSGTEGNLYLLWNTNNNDRLTLTFDSDSNGEVPNPADIPGKIAGERFTKEQLPTLKRYGYRFDAWYAGNGNKVGTSKSADKSVKVTPVEADPSIYNGTDQNAKLVVSTFPLTARWLKKTGNVNVEFWDSGTLYTKLTADIWDPLTITQTPVKTGYRFIGWKTPEGEILQPNDVRTPASLDINLNPGGTIKLEAQWKQRTESKLTIRYKDRDLNILGLPESTETVETGLDWIWKNNYELAVPDKILAAYRLDGGKIIEGKPSTIPILKDTDLDLIYGQDIVGSHGRTGSDGIEDFIVERSWELEDGSPLNSHLRPEQIAWNTGESLAADYTYGHDLALFKGYKYIGYYLNQDKNTFRPGEAPNFQINGKVQVTYAFRKITYDLNVHYVDFKGNPLTPSTKTLPAELGDSQDYIIDQSKLDSFNGKSPTGWYMGLPKSNAPSLAEINDMTKAMNVSENGKTAIDITIVYDDTLSVTLPLSMKFAVSNSKTKAVSSKNYTVTNNSTSSGVTLSLDTTSDVKIDKNTAGISLIPSPKSGSSKSEELYLTLKSGHGGFGEQALAAGTQKISGELKAAQSMDLTFGGRYHGDLPSEKDTAKEFSGRLIWHFTPKLK